MGHHRRESIASVLLAKCAGVASRLSLRTTRTGRPTLGLSNRRALGVLATTLGTLLLFGGTALANSTHTFSQAFGSKGSAAGQLELASNSGVAVNDETHDIYVADTGNHRIDEFEANRP